MITATIQAGNTDDKLTQKEWADYVQNMRDMVEGSGCEVHFFGGSTNWQPWQNAAWVINIEETSLLKLKRDLKHICKKHNQESIALTIGQTEFVKS